MDLLDHRVCDEGQRGHAVVLGVPGYVGLEDSDRRDSHRARRCRNTGTEDKGRGKVNHGRLEGLHDARDTSMCGDRDVEVMHAGQRDTAHAFHRNALELAWAGQIWRNDQHRNALVPQVASYLNYGVHHSVHSGKKRLSRYHDPHGYK